MGTSGGFEGEVDDVRILINIPLVNGLVDNVGASVVVVFDNIRISIRDFSELSSRTPSVPTYPSLGPNSSTNVI